MTARSVNPQPAVLSRQTVLSKALCRAASYMGMSNAETAQIIGVSEPTVSRLRNGKYELRDGTKPFELAQYLVRLFRGLDAVAGGDDETTRSWLRSENTVLRGVPVELMKKISGLTAVVSYVDAQRARI
jgi:transcriptional regulator with XRE-family HTH domain